MRILLREYWLRPTAVRPARTLAPSSRPPLLCQIARLRNQFLKLNHFPAVACAVRVQSRSFNSSSASIDSIQIPVGPRLGNDVVEAQVRAQLCK